MWFASEAPDTSPLWRRASSCLRGRSCPSRLAAWQPYNADMLIAIREATRRFLTGHTPYATYRAYDAPWDMAMPYGPALWGPFIVPQLLRLDFRMITIAGELFVPVWCLEFSSTVSPRDVGAGDDPHRLALGVSRVDVMERKE